jgi:hypothetical protein
MVIRLVVGLMLLGSVLAQAPSDTLKHDVAAKLLKDAEIGVHSRGSCSDRTRKDCTSFEGIRRATIDGVIAFKKASGCKVEVTGGTEVGHSASPTKMGHADGYKVDLRLDESTTQSLPGKSNCIKPYIETNFKAMADRMDTRQDGTKANFKRWGDKDNEYVLEGNHWDVLYK